MEQFDVAVLGGGPGGYAAAIRSSQKGLRTALVEQEHLGGVCLNWGCIPTKALLKNAEVISTLRRGDVFGFTLGAPVTVDYASAQARSRAVSKKLVSGLEFLMKKNKITVFSEKGALASPGRIALASGRELSAQSIILATGAQSTRIAAWGADARILYSRDILAMTVLPKSLIIIGAGAIGVEFAGIMNAYGVKVTVVEALPALVPSEDAEISAELAKRFKKDGIEVHAGTMVKGVTAKPDCVEVSIAKGTTAQTLRADKILVSVGVKPNSGGIGLEKAGVKTTEKGFIEIDSHMRTNVKGIYAIGDVTGKMALAHTATAQGLAAVADIAGEPVPEIVYRNIPRCTYCSLETASVGLTEQGAKEAGYRIKTGKFPFSANGKALSLGEPEGFVKVVAEEATGEILGVHMIGPHVTEMIAGAADLIALESTAEEAAGMIHPHPTLSEALIEAFHDVHGTAIHI